MNRCRVIIGFLLLVLAAWFAGAGDPVARKATTTVLSQDEQVLQQAGIPLDNGGLLAYFRRRTPREDEQASLRQYAGQLGSGSYAVRVKATDELIRAGRAALPWLRLTLKNADVETTRRAQHCIRIIEQHTRQGLSATVSRVLAARGVPGAVEVLLAYLPFVEEIWVEEEIRSHLKQIALADGKAAAAVEAGLTDAEPKRRAAAAWIVGQSSDPQQRQRVVPRLSDDSREVRFLAASALLSRGEPVAVPALVRLVGEAPPDLAWQAEDLLLHIAGDAGPGIWLDSSHDNNGGKVRAAWESWWKANAAKIDWKKKVFTDQSLGLTLIVENQRADGGSRIYECNAAGQVRWQVLSPNPVDAQWLSGGRLLVGDSRSSQIYEMDTRGIITWKHTGMAPTSCQRLANGNTVVSTYQSIIEFTRDGKTVFSHSTQGHTYHARKLPDGHYIWIDACGEVGEIDATGKEIGKTKVGSGLTWGSVERLRNGHYLVALGGINKVQEIDVQGKVYWEKTVNNPNRAIRLANGHTLVASHGDQCVYEFDAHGTQRSKLDCAGRPFAVQRR